MEVIEAHYESPDILLNRINKIISIIPEMEDVRDWKDVAVIKLADVRQKIESPGRAEMDTYWNEVGGILNFYIFTQKGSWVDESLKVIMEEF